MSYSETARTMYQRVNAHEAPDQGTPFFDAVMEFVFAKVWTLPELSIREKRLISLTCSALSGQQPPLEYHIRGALDSGDFTVDELRAVSVHLAAYAGFPVASSVELMLRKVTE